MSSNLQTHIDHLVFGSYYLSDGVNFIHEQLGVIPEAGGQHVNMGTHNKLINLNHSTYLEVIAIDESLPKPNHPRWFAMDELKPNTKPKLLTWVVRTNNIYEAVEESIFNYGEIILLQRGNYKWQITVPADGTMPMQGLAPTIIQWQEDVHPTQNLSAPKIELLNVEVFHPEAKILKEYLISIGFEGKFNAETIAVNEKSFLKITLQNPKGIVVFKT